MISKDDLPPLLMMLISHVPVAPPHLPQVPLARDVISPHDKKKGWASNLLNSLLVCFRASSCLHDASYLNILTRYSRARVHCLEALSELGPVSYFKPASLVTCPSRTTTHLHHHPPSQPSAFFSLPNIPLETALRCLPIATRLIGSVGQGFPNLVEII